MQFADLHADLHVRLTCLLNRQEGELTNSSATTAERVRVDVQLKRPLAVRERDPTV